MRAPGPHREAMPLDVMILSLKERADTASMLTSDWMSFPGALPHLGIRPVAVCSTEYIKIGAGYQ